MIIKEKTIFWLLLPVFLTTVMTGLNSQEKKRRSADEFLKDIEAVTEKSRSKKSSAKDAWDIDSVKAQVSPEDYSSLMESDIFFRPRSEKADVYKEEVIPLKDEEPEKPMFSYKGRMTLGSKVIVIIEDQNTGKSFSVKEGDMAGEFAVISIDDKEVRLKKKDGEEIVLSTVKEEKKQDKKEDVGDGRDRPLQTKEPEAPK